MRKYDWSFTQSPLKDALHRLRIKEDPSLRLALKPNRDLTTLFFKDLLSRAGAGKKDAKKQRNFNIDVKGEQGSGKSTSARIIKAIVDKSFNKPSLIDDILFNRNALFERINTVKTPPHTIILDDDYDFHTQVGSARTREQMIFAEQALRAEGINFISCYVNMARHLFNFRLESFDIDIDQKANRLILYHSDGGYFEKPVGHIILEAKYLPAKLERDYSLKKKEFTNKVKSSRHRDVQADLDKKASLLIDELKLQGVKKALSKSLTRIHCRRNYPALSESELEELAVTMLYLWALRKSKLGKALKRKDRNKQG